MLTQSCQRWRAGRASYRPARECIDPRAFEVAELELAAARSFVLEHHYAGTFPAQRFCYGLARAGELVGAAVFDMPMQARALDCLPVPRDVAVELGRFVLLDEVGANAESWMLARCFELLGKEGVAGVVSFSDPVPRTDQAGVVVFPGHVGTIYQASNAVYLGKSKAEVRRMLPDGRVLSGRALSKIRKRETGWRYASEQLVAHGAAPLLAHEDSRAWLAHWLALLTRPLRHGGNHKYCWALRARDRARLPASLPYPKVAVPGDRARA